VFRQNNRDLVCAAKAVSDGFRFLNRAIVASPSLKLGHLREYKLKSLRSQISMVLQPPLIFPLSVRDNIAYVARFCSEDVPAHAETVEDGGYRRAHFGSPF
jgi:hypothetical protein